MGKRILTYFLLASTAFLNVQILSSQALKSDLLTYANPSAVGMDSLYIHAKVDSIMTMAIKEEAFPGAQVLVAKNSKIIFHKAYGFHTYDSLQEVGLTDIYDLASVTKIIGPLPALMKLHDQGKLDLDAPFSTYWPDWKNRRDKKDLSVREVFAHQAGLIPYIIFLQDVMKKNGSLKKRFVRHQPDDKFSSPSL